MERNEDNGKNGKNVLDVISLKWRRETTTNSDWARQQVEKSKINSNASFESNELDKSDSKKRKDSPIKSPVIISDDENDEHDVEFEIDQIQYNAAKMRVKDAIQELPYNGERLFIKVHEGLSELDDDSFIIQVMPQPPPENSTLDTYKDCRWIEPREGHYMVISIVEQAMPELGVNRLHETRYERSFPLNKLNDFIEECLDTDCHFYTAPDLMREDDETRSKSVDQYPNYYAYDEPAKKQAKIE